MLLRLLAFLLLLPVAAGVLEAQTTPTCGDFADPSESYSGNVTITSQAEMNAFVSPEGDRYSLITGDLTLVGGGDDPIRSFCNLQELVSVGGFIYVRLLADAAVPTTFRLGSLVAAGGILFFECSRFTRIELPELNTLNFVLAVISNQRLREIVAPDLMDIAGPPDVGALDFRNNPQLEAITLPGLTDPSVNLWIRGDHAALTTVSIPAAFVYGRIEITGAAALTDLNFPNLREIGGSLILEDLPRLTDLSGFSDLREIGTEYPANLTVRNNATLAACCLLPCRVTLNGAPVDAANPAVTIGGNAGDCADALTLFDACAGTVDARWTVTDAGTSKDPYYVYRALTPEADYAWRVGGALVATDRSYRRRRAVAGEEICLTVTLPCGQRTHCEGGRPTPDGDLDPRGGKGEVRPVVTADRGKALAGTVGLRAFPNPFGARLTVLVPTDPTGPTEIELYNVAGTRVQRHWLPGGGVGGSVPLHLTTAHLPAGVYFLRYRSADGRSGEVQKLLKR